MTQSSRSVTDGTQSLVEEVPLCAADVEKAAVSFLSRMVGPSARSVFFRSVASRLLQLADEADEKDAPSAVSLSTAFGSERAAHVPQQQQRRSSLPSSKRIRRTRNASLSSSSASTEPVEMTFDRLSPDVVVSQIFRYFTGRFSVVKEPHSNSLKWGVFVTRYAPLFSFSLFKDSTRYDSVDEPVPSSTYKWNPRDRSEPNVTALWGYFCRDVFRHPWFLFECLLLPRHPFFFFPDPRDVENCLIPRVVISSKMIFSLDIAVVAHFGGEDITFLTVLPPTRGFIHLDSLTIAALSLPWLDALIPIPCDDLERRYQIRKLVTLNIELEVFEQFAERARFWNGEVLSLRLEGLERMPDDSKKRLTTLKLKELLLRCPSTMVIPRELIEESRCLETLQVRGDAPASPAIIRGVILTDSLKSLRLYCVQIIWSYVLRSLDCLESLLIHHCQTDDEIFRIRKLPNLKKLSISHPASIVATMSFCDDPTTDWSFDPSTLVHLNAVCVPIRIVDFLVSRGKKLERLTINIENFDPDYQCENWSLDSLSRLNLKLGSSRFLGNENLIVDLPTHLEELGIECTDYGDDFPPFLAPFLNSSILSNLTRLDLCGNASSCIIRIYTEADNLTKLTNLRITAGLARTLSSVFSRPDIGNLPPWLSTVLSRPSRIIQRLQIRLFRQVIGSLKRGLAALFHRLLQLEKYYNSLVESVNETLMEQKEWIQNDHEIFDRYSMNRGFQWEAVFGMGIGDSGVNMKASRFTLKSLVQCLRALREEAKKNANLAWTVNFVSSIGLLRVLKQLNSM